MEIMVYEKMLNLKSKEINAIFKKSDTLFHAYNIDKMWRLLT